jgi:D-alanyl-D-alanine carboxypeptidase/D-alanyl-D-alanine-endopeptidase (penicillin-binding protein 4)
MVSESENLPSRRANRENRGKSSAPRRARSGRKAAGSASPTMSAPAPSLESPVLDPPTLDPITGEPIAPPDRAGIGGFFVKHSTILVASSLGVVFLLLGTGAVFAGAAFGDSSAAPEPTASAVIDDKRATPDSIPAASRLRTCTVAELAADPRLLDFHGVVMNAATGEVLFDRASTVPARTGSVLKIVTAAAALSALGPDYQISTTVVEGSRPGSIVLVGGGDPTISRVDGETYYAGAPKLATLAANAKAAYETKYPGVPITEIVVDSTLWNIADRWDPAWDRKGIREGYHSEVVALQVDGDRSDPSRAISPRSTDAIGRAAEAFAEAMNVSGVTITRGSAVSGIVLAEVRSQPVSTLVGQMLLQSDNTLGEQLARLVSVKLGMGGSAESLSRAIPAALELYDIPTTGLSIRDGSGLSRENAVPPLYIAQLMVKVINGANSLAFVNNALPVAGESGTLAGRFKGSSAVARGAVTAKTGWIETAYSLGGAVRAEDGSTLTFAFYAIGDGIRANAKDALDELTAGVFNCGDNLANI